MKIKATAERIASVVAMLLCAIPFSVWQGSWLAGIGAYMALAFISYRCGR